MKINVYQIPLAFSLLGAAAMVVLPLFGMAQAQAQKIGVGIMILGSSDANSQHHSLTFFIGM